MLHEGHQRTRGANVSRWKSERGGLLWGRGPSVAGRSFEEDLALFEQQVREEAGQRNGQHRDPVPSRGTAKGWASRGRTAMLVVLTEARSDGPLSGKTVRPDSPWRGG